MTIEVAVRKALGAFAVDARFTAAPGLTALFGPSGSGKTSVVNMIAGLLRPDEGRIAVDGRVLTDTASGRHLLPHRRRIGYVFQDARLFPHLSVRSNLLYGRWFAPRAERYVSLEAVVEMLGIGGLLDRRPGALSGGERQRVAIGRALLAAPRLLLLDEPLAALDEARKAEIMPFLERLRDEVRVPIVYVSHSVAEVARLATSVVMMDRGRVTASGSARDMLQRLDLLAGTEVGEGGALLDMEVAGRDEPFAMTVLRSPAGEIRIPATDLAPGAAVRVRIRARDVLVATRRPEGLSALNVLAATVASVEPVDAAHADVHLDCAGEPVLARITRRSVASLGLAPGMAVFAVIKTVAFDAAAVTGAGTPAS